MSVIALYNLKGGVGKTASAVNLSYITAMGGERTLLWDMDPQAAATFYLRTKAKIKGGGKALIDGKGNIETRIKGTDYANLDLLPADFSFRNFDVNMSQKKKPKKQIERLLKPLIASYDHMFIDCAPGISLVSDNVFRAIDVLMIPLIPTTLSLRTLKQIESYLVRHILPKKRLQVIAFFCMFDRRKKLHRKIYETASASGATELLQTPIPYSSIVEQMGLNRAPLPAFARGSAPARAYEALAVELFSAL